MKVNCLSEMITLHKPVTNTKILLAEVNGEVFAVSNKCSHLGLPLVGKVMQSFDFTYLRLSCPLSDI
jgi:nitrite reductase/ring-hydroxylating ferredoxin subunit